MDINYILISAVLCALGFAIGYSIAEKNKCKHNWELLDSGQIARKDKFGSTIIRGFIKVYECKECKKMKKEQVTLDN